MIEGLLNHRMVQTQYTRHAPRAARHVLQLCGDRLTADCFAGLSGLSGGKELKAFPRLRLASCVFGCGLAHLRKT